MSVFRRLHRGSASLPLLLALLVAGMGLALADDYSVGRSFTYAGFLEHDGVAINTPRAMRFRLYASSSTGACQTVTFASVPIEAGAFSVVIDDVDDACLAQGQLFLDVAVADANTTSYTLLGSRSEVTSLPFASAIDDTGGLLVNDGDVVFTDPQSADSRVLLTAHDAAFSDTGVSLRPLTSTASGDALFRVLSNNGVERLRVEHDGEVSTTGDVHATGTVSAADVDVTGAYALTHTDVTHAVLEATYGHTYGHDIRLSGGGNTQDDVFDDDHNPEDLAIAREERRRQREALSDAVQLLDAQEREFLLATLRMSAAEAQRTLGYPPGSPTNAAHKRTHLLKKLRQAVAPKMADGAEEAS